MVRVRLGAYVSLERAWIHFKGFSTSTIFSNDLIGYMKTIYLDSSCDWITLEIHNVGLFSQQTAEQSAPTKLSNSLGIFSNVCISVCSVSLSLPVIQLVVWPFLKLFVEIVFFSGSVELIYDFDWFLGNIACQIFFIVGTSTLRYTIRWTAEDFFSLLLRMF
jgi:hypothetical protein